MDDASDADKAVCRSLIPKPVAWAIDTFFTRNYQRRAYRCWYLPQHFRLRRQLCGQVSVDIAAPAEAVWKVVTDPTRTPQWSHECRHVEFLDGATAPGYHVRFRGTSRSGRNRWSRACTIFESDEHRQFGYLTSGGPGDATAWRFRLEPTSSGTRLSQVFQIVSMPRWVSLMVALLIPAHDDRSAALRGDLQRLAAVVEREHRRGRVSPTASA